jgi:hypothetical protein
MDDMEGASATHWSKARVEGDRSRYAIRRGEADCLTAGLVGTQRSIGTGVSRRVGLQAVATSCSRKANAAFGLTFRVSRRR